MAVEDEVGAEVDEDRAAVAAEGGDFADGLAVDVFGFFFFLFAEVDFGVGGAIQDERWAGEGKRRPLAIHHR